MIEVVSYPANLAGWKASVDHPFYLEVFGETRPVVDANYAEVQPAGAGDAAPQLASTAPVYEYWWTIGHGGRLPQHHHWLFSTHAPNAEPDSVWDKLDNDVAARVYFFFPVRHGWRIKELAATVKYLSPVGNHPSFLTALAKDWKNASPLVADAGQAAALLSPIPGAGGVATEVSTVLTTLAKLQINSVPPSGDFAWSAAKVTFVNDAGAMQGVMWELPKAMFTDLGGRLTGSLALSFIPARAQIGGSAAVGQPDLAPGVLSAHAVVLANGDQERWAPSNHEFVDLAIAPQMPAPKE